jgi:parallel beta-helix repeat protein
MKWKAVSAIMLTLLLMGMLTLAFNIQPVKASGTIYIRADGSIDPPTAPITTVDNVTYILIGNISSDADGIVIARSNIIIDGAGYTVEGTRAWGSDGIYLSSIINVTIKNINIKNFQWVGINLRYSSYNSIYGNNVTATSSIGINLESSNNNIIVENNITANNMIGIVVYDSLNNTISGNNITNHSYYGVALSGSLNNKIFGNNLTNNGYGIYLEFSSNNNLIYHNNFVGNGAKVSTATSYSVSIWDNGYPSGGNYWSLYGGTDLYSGPYQNETGSDGIGDTPYVIGANNTDRYPLMNLWSPFDILVLNVTPSKTVVGQGYSTNVNVTVANQGDYTETFDVTLYAQSQTAIHETGLVGYWNFNEGTGTTAYDSSGNGNNGTLMNGPTWVDGKIGKALSFDGTDDFVRVNDSATISSPSVTRAITVIAWVKSDPGSLDRTRVVASHWSDGERYGPAWVLEAHNDMRYHTIIVADDGVTSVDLLSNTPVQEGVWQHLAFTWDGSIVTFYFNGVVDATATYTSSMLDSSCYMQIGKTDNIYYVWKGLIDNAKLYNRTLSASEIWSEYISSNETGLVGYWKFDEGTGTTAYDSSGYNNNGTLYNDPVWADGRIGKALSFDGVDDCVEINAPLLKQLPLTLSAWIKPELRTDGTDFPSNVISNDRPGYAGHGFGVNVWPGGSQMKVEFECEDAWRTVPGVSFNAGSWYHVAVVYTSGNVKSYINGQLVDDFSYQQQVLDAEDYFRVGKHNDDTAYGTRRFFSGIIDEVKIYNRSLSADEVWAEYTRLAVAIQTQTITLESGTSTTLTFTWNTTGFAKGNYTIWAYATPVPGEIDTADNTFIGDIVTITIPGDMDGDFWVFLYDAVKLLSRYGAKIGNPQYDAVYDIDNDGRIFLYDAVILLAHYGQKDP